MTVQFSLLVGMDGWMIGISFRTDNGCGDSLPTAEIAKRKTISFTNRNEECLVMGTDSPVDV